MKLAQVSYSEHSMSQKEREGVAEQNQSYSHEGQKFRSQVEREVAEDEDHGEKYEDQIVQNDVQ